jgi:hypothetical protein
MEEADLKSSLNQPKIRLEPGRHVDRCVLTLIELYGRGSTVF